MIGCDVPALRYDRVIGDWKSEGYPEPVLEKILYCIAEAYFGAGS